ncbi:HNH endonuclease signature motif containing protein [Blastococcus sp. VKM Ac-2987]|uniref:HNH endonuclease signature motif containing protein n=1 Tax=Blastococcus sp. VKM Ac-2987 TaxID=3004141 RepID=UPI0022ABA640|nr:HNH endonuclease signature motif containing protein [Blastococcus sp. VKM Ac-2987]MCZ2858981.1 DUF222 domain-containing protein [Blastococcus sp. VKM Ac-2987]
MSAGGAFAVGVTIIPVDGAPSAWELADPDPSPSPEQLGELLPPRRSAAEVADLLQQITAAEARLAALKVELVLDLAAARPAGDDSRPGGVGALDHDGATGLDGVSEFLPDELALILNCSRAAASTLLELSATLTHRLPATRAELGAGRLDWPRVRAMAAEVGRAAADTDPAILAAVEEAVLPAASEASIRRLRETVRCALIARDAAAVDRRRRQAERAADVTVRPVGDGMSELGVLLPHETAVACRDTADRFARAAKDAGDPRPTGMLRAGAAADLMLRPWDDSRPPVTAHLTVVAPLEALAVAAFQRQGGPAPAASVPSGAPAPTGEVDGEPITAAHVRELLTRLDALGPGGLQAAAGGSLEIAVTDRTGRLLAVTGRAELGRLAVRGCPDHLAGGCACAVLGPPGTVDRYSPAPAQRRFVRTRDRICRHPGCTVRAVWADLDHVVAHGDGGETSCANLCCLCRRHHRLKTHADGWQHTLDEDGILTVITPSGVTRTSRPPGWQVLYEQPAAPAPPPDDPPPF